MIEPAQPFGILTPGASRCAIGSFYRAPVESLKDRPLSAASCRPFTSCSSIREIDESKRSRPRFDQPGDVLQVGQLHPPGHLVALAPHHVLGVGLALAMGDSEDRGVD